MEPKIDPRELAEIVEETARIQERDAALLDPAQAREILRELELPAEHLEEARAAVAVRRVHERERATRTKLSIGALVVMLGVFGVFGWRAYARNRALASTTTSQAVLTVKNEPVLRAVERSSRPELSFEAVLSHPPQGASLELSCDWLGPSGELRYQNRWHTRAIDKDAWPTHCAHRFGLADPSGEWSVRMRAGDHLLAGQTFRLE